MNRLPAGVVALGFVSLLMDVSSEMIHSLLPIFMVGVLGASALVVGVIEGVAEATAAITKIFSGAVSDWLGRRKPLLLLGYGLAALTKPLFPLATGIGAVMTARFIDRIGKGIRGAPRDALVADLTPPEQRGAAYGLRQSMDTVGAFLGPALALALMAATAGDFRLVFWFAAAPAFLCVAVIAFGIREPEAAAPAAPRRFPIRRAELARLPPGFWQVTAFAAILTLARFSEAFLLLRAENVGLSATWIPAIMIVMNITYAASAYPFGRMSDDGGRHGLLALGIGFLIAADLILALAGNAWTVGFGAVFWGLHMGATQGLLSALVAEAAPADLRGTAFGIFNLLTGIVLLVASVLAGGLWTLLGPAATFLAGAAFAAVALPGLLRHRAA
ncbi:MAG: MFS transporter [Candidatus Nitricoxidivorans perseverans]|uniref:MFS transporter n=1 Tax=Candidatus Nitricoxidivorans perseverans TaxID=2975601 RepID=A0AA49IXU1_9PROT|nr:MAG: MFS transporter [Candidatus Nitricoxidivorans perseverans]